MCPVKDYFNGTYLCCCSVDTTHIQSRYAVQIKIQFKQFDAYDRTKSADQMIWNRRFNPVNKVPPTNQRYEDCRNVTELDFNQGYWSKSGGRSTSYNRYVLSDKRHPDGHCIFPLMTSKEIKSCFKHKFHDKLLMIGDSHIRYAFYTLIRLTTGNEIIKLY